MMIQQLLLIIREYKKKKRRYAGSLFFYLSTVYSRWSSVGQARRDCRRWPKMQRFRNEIWNWKAKCKPVVEWSRDFVELVWVDSIFVRDLESIDSVEILLSHAVENILWKNKYKSPTHSIGCSLSFIPIVIKWKFSTFTN